MDDASSGGSAPNLRNNESGNTTKTESEETSNIKSNTETIASENINGISNTNSATTNSNGSNDIPAGLSQGSSQQEPEQIGKSEKKEDSDTCENPTDSQATDKVATVEASAQVATAQNSNSSRVDDTEDDYEEDNRNPISFDVIKPNRPLKQPAPPVDHGSIQGGINLELPQE
jgi:hypothetical protein